MIILCFPAPPVVVAQGDQLHFVLIFMAVHRLSEIAILDERTCLGLREVQHGSLGTECSQLVYS